MRGKSRTEGGPTGEREREGDATGRWRSLSEREEISPEEKLGMAGDGDGGGRSLREEGDLREEEEPEKMAARRSGGGGGGGGGGLRTAASR